MAERSPGVLDKWRPPLALVLGGSLLAVLVLPVLGLMLVDVISDGEDRIGALVRVGVGALGVTLILGWLLWRLILGPVRALSAQAEAIRAGTPPPDIVHYGTPEIGELGRAVLHMAQVLKAREMQVRSYTDHVTHELKTPLTAIRGAAELLQTDDNASVETRRLAGTILHAEDRAERLLAAALDIAAARTPSDHGQSSLNEVAPRLEVESMECRIEGGAVPIPLSADGLTLVLTHLVGNAAAAGANRITLDARSGETGRTVLTVSDDGPGISAGNRSQIFEPFFTTRRESGGTGMGLAIVQTKLLAHGAAIELVDGSEKGATFRIIF